MVHDGLKLMLHGDEIISRIDKEIAKQKINAKPRSSTLAIAGDREEERMRAAIVALERLYFIRNHVERADKYLLGWGDVNSLGHEFYAGDFASAAKEKED